MRPDCDRFLVGHGPRPATWQELQEVTDWCREHGVEGDVYGDGAVINDFEAEVAQLLGMDAGLFMPSGTMAQQIAARIWCDRAQSTALGMHSTCHMELHEHRGYSWLHGLRFVPVGERFQPLKAAHLAACPERLGVLVVELPMREIGGVLPEWSELVELKALAKSRGVKLHLDGARLWEAQPYYGKSHAEICAGFDSVYVSFYKGIGNLSGAMLLGSKEMIAEARLWQRRHGGNLYQLLPYVASARLNFAKRLPRMAAYCAEARRVAAVLARIPGVTLRPEVPQANLMHVHFDRTPAAMKSARDRIAAEDRVWLIGGCTEGDKPGTAKTEMSFGDGAAAIGDGEVEQLFRKLMDASS